MPLPDELADEHVDRLTDVSLASFTATPVNIRPFETSVLRWEVVGVPPGVQILLGGNQVAPISQSTTQPVATLRSQNVPMPSCPSLSFYDVSADPRR